MANSTVFSGPARVGPAPHVVVVGAGIGGLVAALGLVAKGMAVTVIERAATPGGKLRQVMVGGEPIDCGPTVLTMRDVFEQVFDDAGTSLAAHLRLTPATTLARHAWPDGTRLDLFADIERSVDAIAHFAGRSEGERYRAFTAKAAHVYRMLEQPFIRSPHPSMPRLLRALGPSMDLFEMSPFSTLWRALVGSFRDPRLRQLFGRYATYCGSSPFQCPATLMLVAHVEQAGVWLVEGGMHRIATVLADLAARRGATFRYATEVRGIGLSNGRAASVELATGERLLADAVVCNADVAALAAGLFGSAVRGAAPKPAQRSLSAVTLALQATTRGVPLIRHNVFFSDDYAAEFEDVFARGRLPRAPTVYICAQDRDASGGLPRPLGAERLFCIVNAPPVGDAHGFDASEIALCEARITRTLDRCGLTIEPSAPPKVTTPADFERLFPATGGALYGAASHGWMASFRRPGVRSRVPGLYLCGGSAHPGPGLPMAALSGRMAAASVLQDWASMRRSRPGATPGGMSTA